MRNALIAASVCLIATGASADSAIQDAIRNRPDLSQFYQALVNTGVINELNDGSYTVFAPTNAAFAKIAPDHYPCFYSAECKSEVADIVRHHIIRNEVYVDTVAQHQGGVYSINHRFIAISEPYRNGYTVDGHNVLTEMMLGSSMLYRIDGVIASDYDLARVATQPVTVEAKETVTTTTRRTTVDDVCPSGENCPDVVSTTVTKTTTTPVTAPPLLAPAR